MADFSFWYIQIPGWALFFYLLVAQCSAAFSYKLGVKLGTQEPAAEITEIGTAFFWGLAFADLVFYTPILAIGLIGHLYDAHWTPLALGAALGTTVYWPIASLATVWAARNAPNWSLPKERQYWIVLPLITAWALGAIALLWPAI